MNKSEQLTLPIDSAEKSPKNKEEVRKALLRVSARAMTADGAKEHANLGEYPDDPDFIK